MTLGQQSLQLLRYLRQNDELIFSQKDLAERLSISAPRLSDILNVMTTMYIISREGHNYRYRYQSTEEAIGQFLADNVREGRNQSISEHTKTVCYWIQAHQKITYSRRTSDVLNVLSGLEIIQRENSSWAFKVHPTAKRVYDIPLCERDTQPGTDFFEELIFSDFDE